ncbi:hypothetical protein ABOM_003970 [Aspergillus bombycis]|uniref:Transcription factor domain-containing protein n=1 Tax=Aspergillus bombycis TaxID=109264 RepID=A0A1F8A5X5_9EURO|nr:hypothetical protein ABOM_003970 [Aspergillus bombycis]OGM47170.1 hypothetical protein ABOM_003970 [Aspergillus bombycis]
MGYQPYQSQISSFEAEMRRRAWLLLLVIDSVVSGQTGLPRVIYPGVGDVTRPRNLLDEDFGPNTDVLPPSRPENQIDSSITYLLAMEQMLAITGEVTDAASGFTLGPQEDARTEPAIRKDPRSVASSLSHAVAQSDHCG